MNRTGTFRTLRRALAVLLLGCTAHALAADNAVSEQVVVAGGLKTSLRLSVDDLRAFPGAQIASVVVTRRVGAINTDIGGGVLVVFERDGQPLADREGRIALVSARDQRGGPPSVRWLARLDVKVVRE